MMEKYTIIIPISYESEENQEKKLSNALWSKIIKKTIFPIYATSGCQEIIERKKRSCIFVKQKNAIKSNREKKIKMQLLYMKMHIHYDHGVSDAEVALL
jgi:hypothetical protein